MNKQARERTIYILYFPLAVIFIEMVLMLHCFHTLFSWGVFYTCVFSLIVGLLCVIFSSLGPRVINRVLALVFLALITLYIAVQAVYFTIFKTFTTVSQFGNAGDVLSGFWKSALVGVWNTAIPLMLIFLPLIILAIWGGRFSPSHRVSVKEILLLLCLAVTLQVSSVASVLNNTGGVLSFRYVFMDTFSPTLSMPRFGAMTTLCLDVKNSLFGTSESGTDSNLEKVPLAAEAVMVTADEPESTAPVTYGDNVLEIDWDGLIANETDPVLADMDEYFRNVKPTSKNEYTGMFEGYNLIWICAEGFSSLAIDKTHTPTLYKLSNEGFVFHNFYNPIWGVSTSDGEYVTLTSLLPESGVWSFSRSSGNSMPFGFGNLLGSLGYTCRAYHDHDYTYYDRDKSHPNMGYLYEGVGNGLELTDEWPESDVEMMVQTIPDYIGCENFHTYYMSVSGHLNYSFDGNMQAYKHMEDVADLPYSEAPRAYIACQMEFDQAVGYLIEELGKAGVLDRTVIVISGDHYPYGLEVSQMEEITGSDIEENFELYHSTLIIWNSQMKMVQVDKMCSSLDIMPTLANLFGLKYDSRLVMGSDILSDSPALVIFNNRSFITDYGRYDSDTDTFTANDGVIVEEGYAASMLQIVNNKFFYSAEILDNNYYYAILGSDDD